MSAADTIPSIADVEDELRDLGYDLVIQPVGRGGGEVVVALSSSEPARLRPFGTGPTAHAAYLALVEVARELVA